MSADVTNPFEIDRKFTTSATVNILNDLQLMNIQQQHEWQRYELSRKYEHLLPNPSSGISQSTCSSASSFESVNTPLVLRNELQSKLTQVDKDLTEDLQILIEQRLPDLSVLEGEPTEFIKGRKFYCTINDILTSDGEFWVERQLSTDHERQFDQFLAILTLFATSYESLKEVYIGQLVALHYESSWHRALVVSKSESTSIEIRASARVRLVDYGSSLYVHVSQLKWLPEQFYLFPFKAVECIFSEAVKPTFSDTVRLTFKQLVLNKRLRATVYDRDGTRTCVVLKCRTDEGIINVYRYLRAREHKCKRGRMLDDGDIVQCLHNTIFNNSNISLDQSSISNLSMNLTLPILLQPSPVKLTSNQLEIRREEIKRVLHGNSLVGSKKMPSLTLQTTPFSSETMITPMPNLSFT